MQCECRLCAGPAFRRFELNVLGRHEVPYFECAQCHSLQTQAPYWLDEAYREGNLSNLDTGAFQRNINNLGACFAIAKLFKAVNAIDAGGGDGLLCRMLRDYGVNCFVTDRHATPTYAQGFTEPDFDTPDLLVCFEVLEHFSNPVADLKALFRGSPRVMLLSTELYEGQGPDWWYLVPESGQHVFFYSRQALEEVARTHGYAITFSGGFILLTRGASLLQQRLAAMLLKSRVCRWIRAWVVTRPTPNMGRDFALQRERSLRAQTLRSTVDSPPERTEADGSDQRARSVATAH